MKNGKDGEYHSCDYMYGGEEMCRKFFFKRFKGLD
jgi:hypothetical protein